LHEHEAHRKQTGRTPPGSGRGRAVGPASLLRWFHLEELYAHFYSDEIASKVGATDGRVV